MKYDFSAAIRARKVKGWTLTEWAKKTRPQIHYSTIAKALERGTAHPRTAKAILKPLGLAYITILPGDEEKKTA